MDPIQIMATIIIAALGGGLIGNIMNMRKTRSESDLNEVEAAAKVITMMQEQHDEQKVWYDLRISILQSEVDELKRELILLREQVSSMRKRD